MVGGRDVERLMAEMQAARRENSAAFWAAVAVAVFAVLTVVLGNAEAGPAIGAAVISLAVVAAVGVPALHRRRRRERQAWERELAQRAEEQNRRWLERGDLW